RYIIQQKPITTIFNLADGAVSGGNPWGMEWSNENLSKTYSTSGNWKTRAQSGVQKSVKNLQSNANDGYANTRAAIGNGGISVDHADIDWKNYPNANNALPYAACMSRNRDEDGNGRIDRDEIKWYLPASNQMQYLWIGMDAVPEDAVLYPKDFRDANQWQFYHHATSDGKAFWAEEGCAIGTIGASSADRLHVRCVRNLGEGNMLSIGEKSDAEGNDVIVTVGNRLPGGVFRQGLNTGKLGIHNEYDDDNKIYKKMQIKGQTLRTSGRIWEGTFKEAADRVYDRNADPCATYGRGWRSPSQREMILITTVGGFSGEMHTVTYYSFWDFTRDRASAHNPDGNGVGNSRIGFSYTGDDLHLVTPGSTNGSGGNVRNIRCVRDIVN
ncbi:MAG: hypothetical protein LBV32_04390, partial [Tannerellaceae bacterium]|nr:hypothetical protein [Tannerellaceae bacterium]